eukprot:3107174-Rhodomonas_salina.4
MPGTDMVCATTRKVSKDGGLVVNGERPVRPVSHGMSNTGLGYGATGMKRAMRCAELIWTMMRPGTDIGHAAVSVLTSAVCC